MTNEEQKEQTQNLLYAVWAKQPIEKIKALIEKGANVNAYDENGWTALIRARTAETTKLLLEAGADVNAHSHVCDIDSPVK